MSKKNEKPAPESMAASWQAALLVCKVCGKRSGGPKKLKVKEVVSSAKRLLRGARPRPRVLTTSCLGLCPKGGIAVARVGGGSGGVRIVAIQSLGGLERSLPMLAAMPPGNAVTMPTSANPPAPDIVSAPDALEPLLPTGEVAGSRLLPIRR